MNVIALQATVGGLAAQSSSAGETVYGLLDVATGMLLVDGSSVVEAGMPEVRRDGCAAVTNNASTDDCDLVFTGEDMRAAIGDYFAFAGRGLLVFEDAQQRHNPASRVAADGVDEHGPKYRVAPDITNGQVAVIVLCWFALKQSGFARQLAAFDDYEELKIHSVGLPGGGKAKEVVTYAMGGDLPIGRDGWPV